MAHSGKLLVLASVLVLVLLLVENRKNVKKERASKRAGNRPGKRWQEGRERKKQECDWERNVGERDSQRGRLQKRMSMLAQESDCPPTLPHQRVRTQMHTRRHGEAVEHTSPHQTQGKQVAHKRKWPQNKL